MTTRPTDAVGFDKYGASMGRRVVKADGDLTGCKLYKVRINAQGYDNGGAYWGTGVPLYCLTDANDNAIGFERATTRDKAIVLFRDRFTFTLSRGTKANNSMRVYLYKNAVRDCYKDRSCDRPIAEATLHLTQAMQAGLIVNASGEIAINGMRLAPSWVGLERPSIDVVANVPTVYPIAKPYAWAWWRGKDRREHRADFADYNYNVADNSKKHVG